MNRHTLYTASAALVFAGFAIVFNTFPRTTFSPLEKRELARFPRFSWERLWSGEFTKSVSEWFSDSEPFRDEFMTLSMSVKHALAVSSGEDNITFHAPKERQADEESGDASENAETETVRNGGATGDEYHNSVTADENAKIANKGIIIVGQGDNVRALMAYGGSSKGGVAYARAANEYKKAFGPSVNVYCMVIPTAVAFYCPEKARKCSNAQYPTISNIHSHLDAGVRPVDVYNELGRHAAEDIFLRTDHHWAPLGAYYAAAEFARVAGVPFRPLESYDRRIVHRYVGSMYGYSNDMAIKNAPEDFVYYVPKGVEYTTTYTDYTVNENYEVVREGRPHRGIFFYKYRDGSGGAYCTFMGGDMRITAVRTNTGNHRRLLILKDSFGNALPGYLFYSFEEIHVVDYRYFTKNMREYVTSNKITDILFANNIFNAYSGKICGRYMRFLTQADGTMPHRHSDRPDSCMRGTVAEGSQEHTRIKDDTLHIQTNM